MARRPLLLLALAALLVVTTLAHLIPARAMSDPCGCAGAPCVGIITIGTGKADSVTFYVDDRGVLGNGDRLYQETNGEDGLQRGGSPPWVPTEPDFCTDDPRWYPDFEIL